MLDVLKRSDITLFKDRDIDLLIESYSNSARILQIRGFTENAQIIANHTTNSDRSLATSTIDITSIPVTLTVTNATASISRGECYVRVSLRVEGIVVALLGACYLTDTSTLQWPGGKIESSIEGSGLIRSITGTDPAAGVEISETVPTGARWRLISMFFPLTADATVINRNSSINTDNGANVFYAMGSNYNQTAGQTGYYTVAKIGIAGVIAGSGPSINIPSNLVLLAGYRIRTSTVNFQAGDNYGTPQYLVEEWIEP